MTGLRSTLLVLAMAPSLCLVAQRPLAHAAIVVSGNVEPTNPATWTSATDAYIGRTSDGSLTGDLGSDVLSRASYLGYNTGTSGTVTISGVGSTWINGYLHVGESGSGALNIEAGGQVSNTTGRLGYSTGSSGTATVSGVGSKWTNKSLEVGYAGNGTLNIAAGGEVITTYGYLGRLAGSSGTTTVSGAGSKWTNSGSLNVGESGNGTLNIAAGGEVINAYGYLGDRTGSSGTATVSGAGSKWANSGSLYVGRFGSGALSIEASGEVTNTYGYLGSSTDSSGTATVTGPGSKWTNSNSLYVGDSGSGSLSIEAGGEVSNGSGYLGSSTGSSGTATVMGAGSKWTNSGSLYVGHFGNGTLTVNDGGLVTAATLYASLGNLAGNGTISVRGVVVDADLVFDAAHGLQQTIAFGTGGALNLNLDGTQALGAGYQGHGTLRIADGVTVGATDGYLGLHAGSSGAATVSGPGSKWSNSGPLYVGSSGSGSLSIEAGGEVTNTYGYLGNSTGSSGTATVTGAGSKWSNSRYLYVGHSGSGSLNIEAGGQVINGNGYLGLRTGSSGTATVSGAGSKWTNSSLYVGDSGSGSLNIEAGGEVGNHDGYLGSSTGSSGTATVTGAGSKWASASYLYVGNSGSGSLNIEAGGEVSSRDSYLGYYTGSSGTATVSGAGSKWTINGSLYVGRYGNGTLTVNDGGLVTATTLYASLGDLAGDGAITARCAVLDADLVFDAANGLQQAIPFGTGGTLNLNVDGTGALGAGYKGSGTLRIADGVTVRATYGYLGYSTASSGTATVSGIGSKWTNSSTLYVGNSGSGALNIEAGGEVSNSSGYVGYGTASSGTATVSGAGSKWTNRSSLDVGCYGTGSLNIESGGEVSSTSGSVGSNAGSSGMATVRGPGSMWMNTSGLFVGYGGRGVLTVEAGGQVINRSGTYIGYSSLASGAVTVCGAGSKFAMDNSYCYVGYSGHGTLNVEAGGLVSNGYGYLGSHDGSSGVATVNGAGSTWSNSASLYVGGNGTGSLSVNDGGLVTATTLFASLGDLSGNGTILVRGAVLDGALVCDAADGAQPNITFGAGGELRLNFDGTGILGAGYKGAGSLQIADGVTVSSNRGYLGYLRGSSGNVRLHGAGSTWNNSGDIHIGFDGRGTLTIEAGGQANNGAGYLGYNSGSGGTAAVHGADSNWINRWGLYVGYNGSGALVIEAGGQVSNSVGHVGFTGGVSGIMRVRGAGSKWTNTGSVYVGDFGSGMLTIEAGGQVDNGDGFVGYGSSSSGTATVCGVGSKWINRSTLYVGNSGKGTLTLADGGAVTASAVSVNSKSLLAIDVANGSRLTVNNGTGTITNNGKIRLLAGAGASTGVAYTPISAGSYGLSSGYQAIGGVWDTVSHAFTPSAIEETAAGSPLTLVLATQQRAKISDSATGWSLGESFLPKATTLTITTTAISGPMRTSLEQAVDVHQSLRGGWQFTADSGYAVGDPAYLSFDLGDGYSPSNLSVWRHNGAAWATVSLPDLYYDGRYASFTVTDLDTAGYAMAGTLRRAWGGGADGDDWSQGANWNNAVGLMPTDVVLFDGTTRLTPNNDLENQQIAGLTFAAGAAAFHLGGNAMKVAGKIDDQAAVGQEINMPVEFVAGTESGTVNVVEGGQLTMSQLVSGDQGLKKTGPGLLELIQDAAYSGDTLVEAGVLKMAGLSNSDSTIVGTSTTTAHLITGYIRQDTLTIHAGSIVTISSSLSEAGTNFVNAPEFWGSTTIGSAVGSLPQDSLVSAGDDHGANVVPEPATWVLLMLALLGAYVARRRGR